MEPKYILITRPRPDASAIAEAVTALGFIPLIEPMLEIVPLPVSLPDINDYQALIFTSANAVRVSAEMTSDRSLPVFAVGKQTGDEAGHLGWSNVSVAGGGLAELAALIKGAGLDKGRPLLHLSGEDIAGDMELEGYEIERLPVYKAEKVTALSGECRSHIEARDIAAALFFSARTAENFMALISEYGLAEKLVSIKALSLSSAVEKPLSEAVWRDKIVATCPDRDGVVKLLRDIGIKR